MGRDAGFTLIEIMLSIGLLALLIGGVFSVQRGAMAISADVVEQQEKSMRVSSFTELMRRNLEEAPGNARVHLLLTRGGSDVFIKDFPLAFGWSGVSAGSKSVILRTEPNAVRQFTAVVLYLNEEATQDYEQGNLNEGKIDRATGQPMVRRLELMDGIASLVWKVVDDSKAPSVPGRENPDEWVAEWPLDKAARPSRVRFNLTMADGSEPLDLIFWIPVTASPQQFANVGGGAPAPGGGANPNPNAPGNPPGGVQIPVPVPTPGTR